MFEVRAGEQNKNDQLAAARISAYANAENVTRLQWWDDPSREGMRADPAWGTVYEHVRIANRRRKPLSHLNRCVESGTVEVIRLRAFTGRSEMPARSVSEDSQFGTAGDPPLGIYGENAVTQPKWGDHE